LKLLSDDAAMRGRAVPNALDTQELADGGAAVTTGDSGAWSARTVGGFAALLALALALRIWGLGYSLWYDEGFHVLAARSMLEGGTFCIADCLHPYDRAAPFTWLVVGSFALFGESLQAARLPSVVAGVLLVAAVFVWVRREVSAGAAWAAGVLCAVGPELIGWSQTARFYALQALLVWCGTVLLYSGLGTRDPRRVAALVGCVGCFMLSLRLQVSTLIPIAGLGVWLAGWFVARRSRVTPRAQLVVGAAALALAIGLAVWRWETVASLWADYRASVNLIHAGEAGNVLFYHAWFLRMYSWLYVLFPVAIGIALAVSPRPAALLATMFTWAFVVHSFGAFKGDRLILYTFPFFFVLWGIALAEAVPKLKPYLRTALERLTPVRSRGALDAGSATAVAAVLGVAALNTEALQTTIRLLTVPEAEWTSEPWYRGHTRWDTVQPVLQPFLNDADVVLSSSLIRTLYYYQRTDVTLSRTQLYTPSGEGEAPFESEFWRERTAGVPVISSPASIERIVSCYPRGLILVESGHWRLPSVVAPETADAIERLTDEVELPRTARAKAFVWRTAPTELATDCGRGLDDWSTR
jgi:hypothetical protein